MSNVNNVFHEAFVGDHHTTERLLSTFRQWAAAARWPELNEGAANLADALQAHIDVEEEYVYPAVERYTNSEDRLRTLAVLRKRHLEIPAYASEIVDAAQEQEVEEAVAAVDLLARVLADHHKTEETEIFPLFAPDGPLASTAPEAARKLAEAHA